LEFFLPTLGKPVPKSSKGWKKAASRNAVASKGWKNGEQMNEAKKLDAVICKNMEHLGFGE